MRFTKLLTALTAVISLVASPLIGGVATARADEPVIQNAISFPGNDGKPHEVTFDKNSFKIDGERLVIWSGELHHWRVPHEDGWRDVMQKLRAAGFNAVSLYFFWGMHQSEEGGEFDFTAPHDLEKLFQMAAEEGLYVIARPGPYINAEVSMGGLPTWMVNKMAGSLRSTDPEVLVPSKAWLSAFNEIASKYQVTDGGGSLLMYQVENELINDNAARRAFLKELATSVKADGIDVPLFHNDYGMGGRFRDVENLGLDFYAYDNYPLGFSCDAGRRALGDQEAGFRNYAPNSPMFITEAQGGAFSPWGAPWTENDYCKEFTDPNFTRQWGINNIGNGVTAFNYYMIIGGTNWGFSGAPGSGFTSYDYGAALDEDRTITPKLATQKELGYYQRGVPVGSMNKIDSPVAAEVSGGTPKLYQRQASDGLDQSVTGNGTRYIGAMLSDSNSNTETSFAFPLNLGEGTNTGGDQFSDDDRSARIVYGAGWTQVADSTAYKGTLTTNSTAGATATVTFNGTGLEIVAPRGTAYGKATIAIDGGTPVEFDEWIDTDQNAPLQSVVHRTTGLTAGNHTAVITVLGQPATGGSGTKIAIDAVNALGAEAAVTSYVVNDSDTDFFTYTPAPVEFIRNNGTTTGSESANWTHASGFNWTSGDIQGDETYARTAGNSVEFTFEGTGFEVIAAYSSNHGPADVLIDGVAAGQTTEQVTATAQPQKVIYSKKDLAPGTHTVKLTHTGTFFEGAQDSRGAYFAVDAVRVFTGEEGTDPEPTGEIAWPRIPQQADTKIKVHGRDALMITADLKLGGQFDLYYTTSEVFDKALTTARGVEQTLVGYPGDAGETVLRVEPGYTVTLPAGVTETYDAAKKQLRLNYTHTGTAQDIVVRTVDNKTLVLKVLDRNAAADTWHIEGTRGAGNDTVWVSGADLVRNVTFEGTTAHLTGSMSKAGTLAVTLPAGITSYTWNGSPLVSNAAPAPVAVAEPDLTWVQASEAPETAVDFDDSSWTLANATNPLNNQQGPGSNGVVLDSNRYGFFNGSVWYRARYTAASDNPTLTFRGNGGEYGAQRKNPAFFQVWVNGVYAGARTLNGSQQSIPAPAGAVKAGQPVVVSVLTNNLGLNLDWSDDGLSRQNRGLYQAGLSAQGPVEWRIQGANNPRSSDDEVRGEYNVGGLYGERAGWYLPGYPTSDWDAATDMVADAPGITWYRASTTLNVPAGQDTAWRLELDVDNFGSNVATRTNGSQAYLYVNGWNIGMFIGDVGPQKSFTIPSGWLNPNGENDIAVAVIAKSAGQGLNDVRLVPVHSTTGAPGTFTPYAAPAAATHTASITVDKTAVAPEETVTATATTASSSELGDGAETELTYEWTGPGAAKFVTTSASRLLEVNGTYTVVAVVRDKVSGQALATSAPATVTVSGDDTDRRGPTVTPIEAQFVEFGSAFAYQVEATDRSTPLAYSATGLPAGVSINATTGEITGTPTAKGTSQVSVVVKDALNNSTTVQFNLVVGTSPKLSVASAPARMVLSSDATFRYTLADIPPLSKLSIKVPAGWQVSPSTQWVGNGSAEVTVRAPQTGTGGLIEATVTTPEGIKVSVSSFVNLTDPANLQFAGVAAWDSAEAGGEGTTNGYVSAAIDGDNGTFWHTQWQGGSPANPHYIVVDLGSVQTLTSFTYVPRPKSTCGGSNFPTACNGQIKGYEVLAATGGTWVPPTAAQLRERTYAEPADATYKSLKTGEFNDANTNPTTVTFDEPVTARYLKLRSTSSVGGQAWAAAAELRGSGPAAQAPGTLPDVTLTPSLVATPATVRVGESVAVVAGGFTAGSTVTVTLGTASQTATADANGFVSLNVTVPAGTAAGQVQVKAVSGALSATANITVTTGTDTTPPVIENISDVSVILGSAVNVAVKATDASTPLAYSATGLPAGVTINATTGAITGTPTAVGTSDVTVTVTDKAGNKATETFKITVNPVPDTTAPVIEDISDVTLILGSAVNVEVKATDASTPLAYSATGLPAGVTINATTGAITGTPTAIGTSDVTVTVTDKAGNKATETFKITVTRAETPDTEAPVIEKIADVTVTEGGTLNVAVKATDASTPLAYSASGLPAGVTIDPATGVVSGKPTTPGTYQVTVTVTDKAGNKATETFTVAVKAKPAPSPEFVRTAPYTLAGYHSINGRQWSTTCETYSQTERCRTEIWATVVVKTATGFEVKQGWAFNNLTYLPFMTRAQWKGNPLGATGEWTATDGRQWRTECDTAATGRNACRSYTLTTVYAATPKAGGGYTFSQKPQWVFNNIVMFK